MALKSSFKCNYKPYWLLKERLKNILCHQHWREQSCGWGKQSLWLFAVAPGHCCRQCVTGIPSTGKPWARFSWFQDLQLLAAGSAWQLSGGLAMGCGKRDSVRKLHWNSHSSAACTCSGQTWKCIQLSLPLRDSGTIAHVYCYSKGLHLTQALQQPYTWGNEAFQMLFQRQHYYSEHITTRVLGLPCNSRYLSPMTVS